MRTVKAHRTLIRALNKLIWKIDIPIYDLANETPSNFNKAQYIIAELADAGIEGIKWDEDTEEFKVGK